MKRMLRSRSARVALLGASAFALGACGEEPRDLTFYEDVDQCRGAAERLDSITPADCEDAFRQAMAEHAVQAPRYESEALCEEQHGPGVCGTPVEAGGAPDDESYAGGFSYMPFFMGYMMGNMASGAFGGRPLYRDSRGSYFTSNGNRYGFSGPGSTVRGTPSSLRAPATNSVAKPMSRATVRSSGGFGAARSAGSGIGGFGG